LTGKKLECFIHDWWLKEYIEDFKNKKVSLEDISEFGVGV
jgi:hypothetical protein